MILTNQEIYGYNQKLFDFTKAEIKLPVKINFYLQKNVQLILQLAKEIEQHRMEIGARFGKLDEETQSYEIPEEHLKEVSQQFEELFGLTQEVNIHKFKIDDFANIELTYQEMSAIMFMIEDEE